MLKLHVFGYIFTVASCLYSTVSVIGAILLQTSIRADCATIDRLLSPLFSTFPLADCYTLLKCDGGKIPLKNCVLYGHHNDAKKIGINGRGVSTVNLLLFISIRSQELLLEEIFRSIGIRICARVVCRDRLVTLALLRHSLQRHKPYLANTQTRGF